MLTQAKQPASKTVSYGTILGSGATSNSELPSGVKRSPFGSPKREGGNYSSFTPPPLILQSGGKTKKIGNKKTGPTTISIVTGKVFVFLCFYCVMCCILCCVFLLFY